MTICVVFDEQKFEVISRNNGICRDPATTCCWTWSSANCQCR